METKYKVRRLVAVALVAVLVIGLVMVLLNNGRKEDQSSEATLDDLLSSRSERKESSATAVVDGSDPFFALITTPVCEFYDNERVLSAEPILVYTDQDLNAGNPSNDLLDHYDRDRLIAVGDPVGLSHEPAVRYGGSVRSASLKLAEDHWSKSDGAVLVDQDAGAYEQALYATMIATYVNIPLIVTSYVGSTERALLQDLDVKYTIVCGDIEGYGKVMRLETPEEAQDMIISFIKDPIGFAHDPDYITITNPLDGFGPEYEVVDEQHYIGELFHIYTPGPGAYAGLEEASEGVDFEYTVGDDVKNSIMKFELTFKPHEQDEIDGERIYCFIFYEGEDGWGEIYYIGTCAGSKDGAYETVKFEVPVLGATGNYRFHLEGRNTYEAGSGNLLTKKPVPFDMTMRLESMKVPIYANMPGLSSMAPFQCAFHKGVLMADGDYYFHTSQLENETGILEPAVFEASHEYVNAKAWEIKDDQLVLMAKMIGYEDPCSITEDNGRIVQMSQELYNDPIYVAICGDTNMVPHFYHGEGGGSTEGMGQPGDIIYADVDMDREDPRKDLGDGIVSSDVQDLELPVGRLAGYDVMDVSALIARNLFYDDIIDDYVGHGQDPDGSWKNNGYVFLGSKMPVETMYGTYVRTISDYMTEAGMDTIGTTEERSDYKFAHQFQEGSNYILGGVHGNFYWYVPQCHINTIAGGSAYDVTNVLDMSMGPSTMFLVSCITGRIDGLAPENCLSMAYIHIGVASYVGATRSTLGWIDMGLEFDMRPVEPEGAVLLSEYYTKNLLDDMDAGMALRDAKNLYLPTDLASGGIRDESFIMVQHYVLYGDPAFNPYEPR
ncbi:MAG: C25 family cysteine peptidase [Candidatus Thermoplasmatota archaeon]|nr:C25 family cysteine peptidase [Candidatus Thermoplasmatota archaeon]